MDILIATHNENKLIEIKKIMKNKNINFLTLKDLKDKDEVKEDGKTFLENAYIKAKYYYEKYKIPTIADDSGLSIKSLNNKPGINSKRFNNGVKQNEKIIKLMKNKNNRLSYFTTAIVIIDKKGKVYKIEEKIYGYIYHQKKGNNGFGYDPIFYLKEYNKTFAELHPNIKNNISHRAKAFKKGSLILNEIINNK